MKALVMLNKSRSIKKQNNGENGEQEIEKDSDDEEERKNKKSFKGQAGRLKGFKGTILQTYQLWELDKVALLDPNFVT